MSELTLHQKMLWACFAFFLLTAVPGCSGCRNPLIQRSEKLKDIDDEEKKKKKEEQKPDIEFQLAATVPGDADTPGLILTKPGHTTTVLHEIRANNFNINAEIRTSVTNQQGFVYPVENSEFQVSATRPAPLPKGQLKRFESTYFIPRLMPGQGQIWLQRELRAVRGGQLGADPVVTARMHDYQYYFIVLASDPDLYSYVKVLSSVAAPTSDTAITEDRLQYYRVILPKVDRIVPLPSHSLNWTTIAYLLWDDLDASTFTEDQQTALVDWLHWGGQLIISGPNSLAKLEGSFLGPYLPARAAETVEIDQAGVEEMNGYWSLRDQKTAELRSLIVPPSHPLVGVRLSPDSESVEIPHTGGLARERRVGQGRVVATAFSLTDPAVVRWQSFDSFFNGCLLRRPRRAFVEQGFIPTAEWVDYSHLRQTDSRLVTGLRYFSRDIGSLISDHGERIRDAAPQRTRAERLAEIGAGQNRRRRARSSDNLLPYPVPGGFGVAAWNDRSGAANVARESLRDAAGISVPRGEFVLQVLAIYLLVLAPLNWGIFRLAGRVEWAWAAAPVIAILGAFAVIRYAQLDIGFARSVTEVSLAEVQAGYQRAHVTRYAALYTSLSTSYDVEFEDPASLVQPFGASLEDQRIDRDGMINAVMRSDRKVTLSGFQVASNKTGIVHSEQFCDLGGSFRLTATERGALLENNTEWSLHDAGVLRRTSAGRVEVAWIGDLAAKSAVPIGFVHLADGNPYLEQWNQSKTTISLRTQVEETLQSFDDGDGSLTISEAVDHPQLRLDFARYDLDGDGKWSRSELSTWTRKSRAGEISLGQMVGLASHGLKLRRGETRLIGWSDQEMPGREIKPAAAQLNVRTMFLVHLTNGDLPVAQPDLNCLADVVEMVDQPTVDESQFE